MGTLSDILVPSGVIAKSGDTMTGTLNLPSNGLIVGTTQLVVSGGSLGVGISPSGAKLVVDGNTVLRANNTEGGELAFNNPDNATVGLTVDVGAADTGRIFQTRNNSVLQIGQLVGTGGSISLFTAVTERQRIDSSGNVLVMNNGLSGYGGGSGGSVTQLTSKATGVTLDRSSGKVTMHNAALAANTTVSFVLTNNKLGDDDVLLLTPCTAPTLGNNYRLEVVHSGAGAARIRLTNISAGSLSEAVAFNFVIIKGSIV